MRKMLGFAVVLLALVLGAIFWSKPGYVSTSTSPKPESRASAPTSSARQLPGDSSRSNAVAAVNSTKKSPVEKTSPAPSYVPPAIPAMAELTNLTPATVLENMRTVFHQYAARFGGNPVGTNPEITAVLNGGNKNQTRFLNSEDGLRVNENGELVDNWGTPFFFHQLSAREMEIHSAGPDRVMWTADDLVIK